MSDTYLVLDCNYLAHRAHHTTGGLSHEDVQTGVLYGFFMGIPPLQDRFRTRKIAFCFDVGKTLREQAVPSYKASRRIPNPKTTLEEKQIFGEVRRQIELLRTEYLPELGYKNIFWKDGYEADDIIASVVLNLPNKEDKAVMVSADEDLYQLLSENVSMWKPRPKLEYTAKSLQEEYGIPPSKWARVKAIAGCGGDDVEGVEGVGDKTAAKFLTFRVKTGSVAYKNITSATDLIENNLKLVTLPYQDTPVFTFQEDEVTPSKQRDLFKRLGMKSLLGSLPLGRVQYRMGKPLL